MMYYVILGQRSSLPELDLAGHRSFWTNLQLVIFYSVADESDGAPFDPETSK